MKDFIWFIKLLIYIAIFIATIYIISLYFIVFVTENERIIDNIFTPYI